jgi:hypothetical protein
MENLMFVWRVGFLYSCHQRLFLHVYFRIVRCPDSLIVLFSHIRVLKLESLNCEFL